MISNSGKPIVDKSEHDLMSAINKLSDAGGSVIQVRTREPLRAAIVLRKHFVGSDIPYKEWDVINGNRVFTKENYADHKVTGDTTDLGDALMLPLRQLRESNSHIVAHPETVHYFVFVNPEPYIKDNPIAIALLQQYAAILPTTNVCTILITTDEPLRDVPVGCVLTTDFSTPSAEELYSALRRVGSGSPAVTMKVSVDEGKRLANLGLGLSLYEFETYVSIALIDAAHNGEREINFDMLQEGIAKGKTAIVRQSEILDLTHTEDLENVGGMGRLKEWITARANCYSDEAKEFGIESPKGMVLVGVPGTGKSLVAKVTASVLQVPLVRLDFGKVFSKYVGDSESRVRSALTMVENMAPVVLFVDEIDKGLAGSGGSGDSGTSSRVLGSYLTWLQECKAPVFNVVTANRIDVLPPELLRRGRFDAIFSAIMPTGEERREVLAIHLRKRGRDIEDFSEEEIQEFLKLSNGYVPAEIESVVKDALVAAFNDPQSEALEMQHLLDALIGMVPMSKSHKEVIDRITNWAKDHSISVSYPEKVKGSMPTRIIRTRRS
jgi:AAA+ superfamily predicted ATPase